ncbi:MULTISPECIES: GtrA family protein [unclassified Ruegeria]|uniref:GtrA family protein n=1 Tax=unclassified Ruegeria TaxID=2625375 RepID=UPI0014913AD8|nr:MULTISPECIES: GtrA family protein [unclassified Ruegeria]NOD49794.1 GtrA family protein [Ruegeria sp. HKCCD5849]NOD54104.1 GtrA family protein [Ruegeria sp. HKCCD5851]NOD70125.1 GtrA family protein [Ruegeria sp. HKCCD7303]
MKKLLVPRKKSFMRFAMVGVLNTAFGYALFTILNLSGLPPQVALVISFSGGVLWNFMTHARLVFDTKGLGRLPFYILSYLVVYAFNALSLEGLLSVGFQPIIAQGIIVLPAAILAFILISRVLTDRFPWQQEV